MLREAAAHGTDWCEMTMSMLREKQYEACERRLCAHPGVGLFSPEATDADAQALMERSYYFDEGWDDGLPTLEGLRERVKKLLPLEARYLSQSERELLERLLVSGGTLTSTDWEIIDAAEGLASRLWCAFHAEDDSEEWTLELPESLHAPLLKALQSVPSQKARERMFRFDATIHGLLYIAGFLHSSQPAAFFLRDVMRRADAPARRVAYRYLKATFEYMDDLNGDLILVHPGLADPYRLVYGLNETGVTTLEITQDMVAGGMNGVFPEEIPLHETMRGTLEGALRPDYDADECAEDLRMLIKQGVSLDETKDVLASMLCVLPTPAMEDALTRLYQCTPHWIGMKASLQH